MKLAGRRGYICGLVAVIACASLHLKPQVLSTMPADDSDHLWSIDRSNIERIAQLTATRGGTILFVINRAVGYASAGKVRRLELPKSNSHCRYWGAALSHDGHLLAFLSGERTEHCTLSIYDTRTNKIRPLLDLPPAPAALSWSWDDTEIAFSDPRTNTPSIRSVSVRDGSVRTIVTSSQLAIDKAPTGIQLRFDADAPMAWSHTGNELVVGFRREIPTAQPSTYSSYPVEYTIDLGRGAVRAAIGDGYGARVSPVADRIAWYRDKKIAVANLDGTDREVLTSAPRWMLFLPGDFKGPLVWSPDGEQLVFGTFESETCKDDIYILQVKTKRSQRFLHRTCIVILDWR